MTENKLLDMSMALSVNIINALDSVSGHYSLKNQLERSATSIGANIHEAKYAQSKPDFIGKLQIALKECYETEYWLEIFKRTDILDSVVADDFLVSCGNIRRLLISSVTTAKTNLTKNTPPAQWVGFLFNFLSKTRIKS